MLIKKLKERMFAAMKSNHIVEKEIMRTVIGEVTATGADPDDARVLAVLKKLVKSNQETLNAASDAQQKITLQKEMDILNEYLPQELTAEQVTAALQGVAEAIKAAANEGQAMGVAMKQLKSSGAVADGKVVAAAVKGLRA